MVLVNHNTPICDKNGRNTSNTVPSKSMVFGILFNHFFEERFIVVEHAQLQLTENGTESALLHLHVPDLLDQSLVGKLSHFGNFSAVFNQVAYVQQFLQVFTAVITNVRRRPLGLKQIIALLPGTNGVGLDAREVLQVLD